MSLSEPHTSVRLAFTSHGCLTFPTSWSFLPLNFLAIEVLHVLCICPWQDGTTTENGICRQGNHMYNTNVGESSIIISPCGSHHNQFWHFLLPFLAALVYGVSNLPRHCIARICQPQVLIIPGGSHNKEISFFLFFFAIGCGISKLPSHRSTPGALYLSMAGWSSIEYIVWRAASHMYQTNVGESLIINILSPSHHKDYWHFLLPSS